MESSQDNPSKPHKYLYHCPKCGWHFECVDKRQWSDVKRDHKKSGCKFGPAFDLRSPTAMVREDIALDLQKEFVEGRADLEKFMLPQPTEEDIRTRLTEIAVQHPLPQEMLDRLEEIHLETLDFGVQNVRDTESESNTPQRPGGPVRGQ